MKEMHHVGPRWVCANPENHPEGDVTRQCASCVPTDTLNGGLERFDVGSWTFERADERGSVRVRVWTEDGRAEVDAVFDPETWAAAVAAVSERGESHGTFVRALEFHQRR